jgi:hypothetical protein
MIGTLFALFIVHKRHRDAEREKRLQYWREQRAFRENIHQMRENAQSSLRAIGSQRSTVYSQASGFASDDSGLPMLGAGASGSKGSSRLKHEYTDDADEYSDESNSALEPALQHSSSRY